jgi:pimeloyl-ACP methyl ester carboxylesterase
MNRTHPHRSHLTRRLAALAIASLILVFTADTASADSLRWHPCGKSGAECSSLQVPLDWARPDGEQISVGITRHAAADPAHSLGVLFFNPGGPGAGTREVLRDYASQFFPRALFRRFEIVGVDLRGAAPGRPAVECGLPTRNRSISLTPTTRAGYERLLAYTRRLGRSCLARTGPLLSHVDTLSAARDLDAAREALGVEKVSWLGISYGSLLGQTYAHLYPSHLRAAVLDGALDHAVGSTRLALDEARSAEAEFGRFAAWCDGDPSCALHGRDVKATYRSLLDQARRRPLSADGSSGGATAEEIGYGTFGLMEVSKRWPLLAELLAAAAAPHPNAAPLARIAVPSEDSYLATTCQDLPSQIHGYGQFERLLAKLRKAAPVFGPYVEGWNVDVSCMGWPVASRNPWGPVPVSGTPPLLVVSGAHDPSTPNAWGRGMARQIEGSRLLEWDGSGHTGFFNDASVKAREARYLLAPTRPVPGTIAGASLSRAPRPGGG